MPFSALQCDEMFAERPFCLFTPGEIFPRFSNFNLLIRKNGKFWYVCTVFDRKRKNTENDNSTKRNWNFVKRRNGFLTLHVHQYFILVTFFTSMLNFLQFENSTSITPLHNIEYALISHPFLEVGSNLGSRFSPSKQNINLLKMLPI